MSQERGDYFWVVFLISQFLHFRRRAHPSVHATLLSLCDPFCSAHATVGCAAAT